MTKKISPQHRIGHGGLLEVSEDVTLNSDDWIVLVYATAGPITITLFDAVGWGGKETKIKKVDSSSNTVTIIPKPGETIDGAASTILSIQNENVDLISDNENFLIISNIGGVAVSSKSFLSAGETGNTTAVVTNPIEFDNVNQSRGTDISLNVGNNKFTLQPGKTYKLIGAVLMNVVVGAINYRWRDLTNVVLFGNDATARSQGESTSFSSQPVALGIITVPAISPAIEVILEITSFGGVTPATIGGFSYAMIEVI